MLRQQQKSKEAEKKRVGWWEGGGGGEWNQEEERKRPLMCWLCHCQVARHISVWVRKRRPRQQQSPGHRLTPQRDPEEQRRGLLLPPSGLKIHANISRKGLSCTCTNGVQQQLCTEKHKQPHTCQRRRLWICCRTSAHSPDFCGEISDCFKANGKSSVFGWRCC